MEINITNTTEDWEGKKIWYTVLPVISLKLGSSPDILI